MNRKIAVAARESPLSRVQAVEVLNELHLWDKDVQFDITWLKTTGDIDQQTSLRSLNKTDFFTREIDNLLLNGSCRIGIHSAKDLPDPLRDGLTVVAITQGLDSSDVLVLRRGLTLATLSPGAVIATSSERREDNVRQLRHDLSFVDLRGAIAQRIEKIDHDPIVGVVVAKAALIRLGMNDLNEIVLPGTTTHLQGQLAIVARVGDREMEEIFRCIDCGVR